MALHSPVEPELNINVHHSCQKEKQAKQHKRFHQAAAHGQGPVCQHIRAQLSFRPDLIGGDGSSLVAGNGHAACAASLRELTKGGQK